MHVLIAVRHRVQAWTIQPAYVNELRRRFPHITFLHSTTRETDIELAETADIIFALSLPKEAVARAARLNWLHCSGHAVGHFPLADLAARGITVTNSRGVQAVPIASESIPRRCLRTIFSRLVSSVWPSGLAGRGRRAGRLPRL